MLRKVSFTMNMNKMSVLGLTFVDIDGQIMAFLQTRNTIFPRNNLIFYSKLNYCYKKKLKYLKEWLFGLKLIFLNFLLFLKSKHPLPK